MLQLVVVFVYDRINFSTSNSHTLAAFLHLLHATDGLLDLTNLGTGTASQALLSKSRKQ
jgi:hypothetical protein